MSYGGGTFGLCAFGSGLEGDPITNLGFELGSYGLATQWSSADFSSAAADWAAFNNGASAYEDFETGWGTSPFYIDTTFPQISAAFTGAITANVEDFGNGWGNDGYLLLAMPLAQPTMSVTGGPTEGFGKGWSSDENYVTSFIAQPYLTQNFVLTEVTDFEEFVSGWSLAGYATDISGISVTSASFAGLRALAVENFENVQVDQNYTAVAATDQIVSTAHGLSTNYRVVFDSPVAGGMPSPLAPSVTYFAVTIVDGNNFKVSLASGGSVVDITTAGSGLLQWTAPFENWVTLMATI